MKLLLDPAILFFVFGVLAGAIKSNLEVPRSIAKFLSMYLLMALGLKGGFALAQSGLTQAVLLGLLAAITMAFVVPAIGYALLKTRIAKFDAAAVAASYGSVSAVTFLTASQFLDSIGHTPGGHMAVAMVLMETPAILMAVILANGIRASAAASSSSTLTLNANSTSIGKILHESFTDGAQLLLLSSMAVGLLSGEAGKAMMQPFADDLFKGMLAFFLLDMGLMVAKSFGDAKKASPVLIAYAVLAPLVHALLALGIATAFGMSVGDTAILMVLSASASYIVVPAVLRYAIPEANPAIYLGLSLGITFPLNIIVGIPLYTTLAKGAF